MSVRAVFHLRRGETTKVLWVAMVGMAYAAATALGDDIAQSIFVSRLTAEALPEMFLFKGLLDVVASILYLPLARGRRPGNVWRSAIAIYVATTGAAWFWVQDGSDASAYGLYVLHECAWTILTIHWAVFILDVFDANQARRLFPLLFAITRLGGMAAGTALNRLAVDVGAVDLLWAAAATAALSGVLSLGGRRWHGKRIEQPAGPKQPFTRVWMSSARSNLVRAIAYSTAAMVLVRYGLFMVSMHQFSVSFNFDEDHVAQFLGQYRVWANMAGAFLGILIVPRVFTKFGVGLANAIYAVISFVALASLFFAPSLITAVGARFTERQLKDALKTPLSNLFYGAEPPGARQAARSFMFGAIIPAATCTTALAFKLAGRADAAIGLVALIGSVAALVFIAASVHLNRRWRQRIGWLLEQQLAEQGNTDDSAHRRATATLEEHTTDRNRDALALIARGLADRDPAICALAGEVLSETIPRRHGHDIAATFSDDNSVKSGG